MPGQKTKIKITMRKSAIIVAAFLLSSFLSFSQNSIITGKVIDEKDGTPLSGVSVMVKGDKKGTATEINGSFSLGVTATAKFLTISSVNYISRDINIDGKTELLIKLVADDKALSEVVMVGFGTQRRKDITASVSTIKFDKIKDIPVQSFDQALSGKAAGLQVFLPNGVLNNPPVISVRGVNSITGSSLPLIVIDGVPSFTGDLSTNLSANNPLAGLNPSDIEDIQVLKDAAAAAIYGSRAANGVMLITTKKGKSVKAKVNYDVWIGWTKPYRLFNVLNAQDYVAIKNEAVANQPLPVFSGHTPGSPVFFLDTINGRLVDTKWTDEVYQTGFQHNHNLSVSGASGGTKYYFGASYTKQEGMIRTNEFERNQVRMNIEHKVNNRVSVGSTLNFSRGITKSPSTGSTGLPFSTAGVARLAFVTAPNVSVYAADGRYNIIGIDNPTQRNQFNQIGRNKNLINSGFVNPAMIRDLNKISSASNQFQGTVYADVKIITGLNFRTQYGVNWISTEDKVFYNSLHGDGIQSNSTTDDDGTATNVAGKYNIRNFQNYFTYNLSLYNQHNINITAGSEEQHATIDRWGTQRSGLTDQFYDEYQGNYTINNNPVGNLLTENYLLSFFGRVNYNFNSRYYLSGNFRRDGYSAFSEGKKWGSFAGASVAWAVSEESFWKNSNVSKVLNSLRVRGSYGKVGSISAVPNFGSLSVFGSGQYGLGYPTLFFGQAGNKDLTWETSTKFDAGIQFGLFNDRLTGEITYYHTKLNDLIIDRPLPASMGVPGNSIAANAAGMYNKGIEFTLNAKILDKKDFGWNASFNITTLKNEVTSLAPGVTEITGFTQVERTNLTRVGYAIGTIFGIKTNGVDQETGRRIFLDAQGREVLFNFAEPTATRWRYRDGTVAPPISLAADGKMLANPHPKAYGGLINNFSYRGFDLTIDAFFSLGNYVYFGSRAGLLDQRFWNNAEEVKNHWSKQGDVTNIPRLVYGDNTSNGSSLLLDVNVFKADYLKIRTIALGYTLPQAIVEKAKISSLRIYGQVLNPFIITSYPGIDPEISTNGNSALARGVDRNTVGQARTITLGINVGF